MNSEGWSLKSMPVTTALTPASFWAAEVSIDFMRACACGLLSTLPTIWPAMAKSAPNLARPVTLSTPSGRSGRVPTHLNSEPGSFTFSCIGSGSSHLGGGVHHRANDLVVAGAAAQVAGQPVAQLGLARVGVLLQQRLGGHQEARRADAALQRRVLDELALQRMQLVALGHALDGGDRPAVRLHAQHQARAHEAAVDGDAAGAAVAGRAAFLGAGEAQLVAQHVEQRLLRLAQELHGIAVHGCGYVVLGHQPFLARSSAICAARRARTPATLMRYSLVPRLSSIGWHAARAAASSFCKAASSTLLPTSAAAAGATSSGRGATAPNDTRAA